jgi:hypothetical protein
MAKQKKKQKKKTKKKQKKKSITRGNRRNGKRRHYTRRVLPGPKSDKENVGKPEAEAKVKRILNALAENRWNRKRKLLPNLKLTYPSDDESRQIAELARINYSSWFAHHIHSNILDAHLSHASFLKLSIPQVRGTLKHVATEANRLARMLSKLDVGNESRGSEDYAGWLIEKELALQQSKISGMVLIPKYIGLLDTLSGAAQHAQHRPRHMPKGAGGNPAFDYFIEDLLMTARMLGGHWTNYRSIDGAWKGTLLDTLGILKKYLPEDFFPPGDLGRSVEHIRKKLKDHIQKAPLVRILA